MSKGKEALRRGAGQIKQVMTVDTIKLILLAAVGYLAARLLQRGVIRNIDALRGFPEVSDIVVILAATFVLQPSLRVPVVAGAGVSLVKNLLDRADIEAIEGVL